MKNRERKKEKVEGELSAEVHQCIFINPKMSVWALERCSHKFT